MATFPPLPVPARLVLDDPAWTYGGPHASGIARARVWETTDQGHLAVVTDAGLGRSITNAAEEVWASLAQRFAPAGLVMIEHYATADPDRADTLDQVVIEAGWAAWRHLWPQHHGVDPDALAWLRAHGFALVHRPNTAAG
uniref:hypothetical protein n=1 Tax=Actinokineospora sp. CA-119265 TaxID=3239890 RepID=UPI003F4949B4